MFHAGTLAGIQPDSQPAPIDFSPKAEPQGWRDLAFGNPALAPHVKDGTSRRNRVNAFLSRTLYAFGLCIYSL